MSDKDTRLALAGEVTARVGDLELVHVAEPWRAEWMSLALRRRVDAAAVCVPPRGYREIRIAGPGSVAMPPDASTQGAPPRRGGVFFGETALAGEIGGRCRAGRAKGGG